MKNITLSAEEELIAAARQYAKKHQTTLNDLYRAWLENYVKKQSIAERDKRLKAFRESLQRVNYVKLERKYSREEMNQR